MNAHSYILVFHKPAAPKTLVKNRPVRYRPRLIEKLHTVADTLICRGAVIAPLLTPHTRLKQSLIALIFEGGGR